MAWDDSSLEVGGLTVAAEIVWSMIPSVAYTTDGIVVARTLAEGVLVL